MATEPLTTTVLAGGLAFGEGPRWHERKLWLSDMHANRVVTVERRRQGGAHGARAGRPSGLGWLPDGRMLIVSMEDRKLLRYDGRSLETHADLSELAPNEINDLVVDADGRAYVSQFGFDFWNAGRVREDRDPRGDARRPRARRGRGARVPERHGDHARRAHADRRRVVRARGSPPSTSPRTARSRAAASSRSSRARCPTASASTPRAASGSRRR